MPPVAWLALNTECFEDWKEDARKKLDDRYTKMQVKVLEREALLIKEWGPEVHRKKKGVDKPDPAVEEADRNPRVVEDGAQGLRYISYVHQA